MRLYGPFSQILTMDSLPHDGPLSDDELIVIEEGGILIDRGSVVSVDTFDRLKNDTVQIITPRCPSVAMPGLVDAHTHICYQGSRARDYALRLSGATYQEIASKGGGILDTAEKTRGASAEELVEGMLLRLRKLLEQGVTTCEVKSGYGLTVKDELKMLQAIKTADATQPISLVPTCLAAHTLPKEFTSAKDYLQMIIDELLPVVKEQNLSTRVDIFIEQGAFSPEESHHYLQQAKTMGFSITAHANQFSSSGADVAAKLKANSVDHLEHFSKKECDLFRKNGVVATVLPGASLGLGMPFAPARMMLDDGLCLAIASDWNPGSAPMGQLLTQAALLGAAEKLTMTETLAGITCRAARALNLTDRGVIKQGARADLIAFPCCDYREILYSQGSLQPSFVIIGGEREV